MRKTKAVKSEYANLELEETALRLKKTSTEDIIKQVSDRFAQLKYEESIKKKSYLYDIIYADKVVYKGITE